MADKKSREEKLTTLECMECGYREVFTERQFKFTNGFSCFVCNGPTNSTLTRDGDTVRNRKMLGYANGTLHHPGGMAIVGELATEGGKAFSGSLINISDTITGLKAIQRESRKATADLKEVESLKKNKYLVIELDEIGSVPKILYKGEEVGPLVKVGFNWDTANAHYPSRQSIMIDHYNINTSDKPVLESIRQLVGARGEGRDES